ncbi:MAG: long-chain-fatty-acid--CoA ligase [Gammaproteobacteria bacterium]|nr:long-chain-fatty-acid--CoA ligase [Gammaproteobacteria bacterium]
MEKPWLQSYPEGVPETIDPDSIPSLNALLDEACSEYRDLPAFTNMGHTLTYGELDQKSRYLASFLQHHAKLSKGDRVAVMMPNLLQYPIAIHAILRAGFVVVNVNPLYTPRELEHQLRDSGARAIIILENFCTVLQQVIAKTEVGTVITTQIGDMFGAPKRLLTNLVVKHVKKMVPDWQIDGTVTFRRAQSQGKWQALEEVAVASSDIAFLQYTGGTTGKAKGAMLTHRNMVANVLQSSAWMRGSITPGRDIVITALPLYHIFSLTVNMLLFMRIGGHNVLITNPRDMPGFVRELGRYHFSMITGVNTLFNGLMNTEGFERLDFSHLRISVGGGMAVQRAVAERWQQLTGCVLLQGYGLTETSPSASMVPLDAKDFDGSIGLPLPSTEFSIRDDDGKLVATGEPGEICIRGPQVMLGYWNRPEETAAVMLEDGWFRSGDIGRMDEAGRTTIEDRKKDMILVSGFNVYPNEIEDVVQGHPGVLECAAVAKPDEHSGEVVKVFVVRKDAALSAEDIIEHCRGELTGYKIPRDVEFRDELPKTNVGKILRRQLRDEEKKRASAQ